MELRLKSFPSINSTSNASRHRFSLLLRSGSEMLRPKTRKKDNFLQKVRRYSDGNAAQPHPKEGHFLAKGPKVQWMKKSATRSRTPKSTILIKKTRQIAKIDEKLETVIEKSPNPTFLHGFFAPKSPILAPIWGGPARANHQGLPRRKSSPRRG